MKGIIMMRAKYLLFTMVVLSAILMFTSCQEEPTSVEPLDATQQELSKFSIPDGATFLSATFNIHLWQWAGDGTQIKDINVHRITSPWEELVVTWNNFGGCFAPAVEGSFNVAALGFYSVDVTALVGNWLDGTHPNYGLLLDPAINYPRAYFNSRENSYNGTIGDAPYMEICYELNGATVCEQIEPIGDATLWEVAPNTNLGADESLYCAMWGPAGEDYDKQPIVMFDIESTPQVDCEECDGKVSELTLQYNGGSPGQVMIKQKNGDVVFNSFLLPGDVFPIVGTDNGTFGNEIKIYVDGNENAKIHTSCSKPIGPGLVKGDFEVISGSSKNGGLLCPMPDCLECRGKVTQLTMQYDGGSPAQVMVKQKNGDVVFDGPLSPGDQFTFIGTDNGTFGTEIKIYVDGNENAKIHTSCSQPIGPGLVKGDFQVIEGYSKDNGKLCPIPPPPPPGWCDGKVKALLVEYTGEDCSATNHNQDPSKVECDGDPAFTTPVRILAQDKANPNDNRAKVWFDGQVNLNSTFWIDATNAGENKLKAETHVFIYDLNDNLLQTIEFHTSCSQPLDAGDQFGSILMVDFIPE